MTSGILVRKKAKCSNCSNYYRVVTHCYERGKYGGDRAEYAHYTSPNGPLCRTCAKLKKII